MPINYIYELDCDMTFNNQKVTNIYHFVQTGADGSGDGRFAIGTGWVSEFLAPLLSLLADEVQVDILRIRRLLPIQTQTLIVTINEPGLVAGQPLPTNQCSVLRLYGTRDGRKGIGNMRLPGVDNGFVDEGRIDGSYLALMELYGDKFEADFTDTGWTFRSVVLGTDDVGRKVQVTKATSRIKQLRSRTIGQGQ